MIQHKDIPDDQRHPPKGFETAPPESALIKDVNGNLAYRALDELGSQGPQGVQGPDASAIAKVVVVQKAPGPGQFSDLILAMASILDATAENPYVLRVGPGVYTLSAPLVLKSFVSVTADGALTPVLQPSNPNNDIIQINSGECRLNGFLLRNATGASAAAVRISGSATPATLNFISVQNCTDGLVVETTTTPAFITLLQSRFIAGATTKRLIKVQAGTAPATVRAFNVIAMDDLGTVFEDAILLAGVGARLDGNVILVRSSVGVGNGLHVTDGGEFVTQSGSEFEGFEKNLWFDDLGAAPILRATMIMTRNSTDKDLVIDHVDTIGSATIAADINKVLVDDDSPVKLVITSPGNMDQIAALVRGDLYQADKFSRRINLSKLGRGAAPMGLFSGGELTDGGGLNVAVGAGVGFLIASDEIAQEITWNADTITLTPQSATYIYVNENGLIVGSSSLPDLRHNVVLGLVGTLAAGVHYIQDNPMDMKQIGNYVELFNRRALGPIYESGSITEEGTTPFTLNIGNGKYWFGTTPVEPLGASPITFQQFFKQAISGFNVIAGVTIVDNANYDAGTGALTPIPAGRFVKHGLYVVGEGASTQYFLVTAQAHYATLLDAEGADVPSPPSTFVDGVVLIATIIVQQGAVAISQINDVRPVVGFKAPGVSASSDHGNLFGLGDDDHTQYLLANGGRAMGGNLNMGGNSVTNVGLVDGVDVSAHASRHLPNGADPIAIGTPSTIGTTNDPGNSNDHARGNHSHAHGNLGGGATHAAATTTVNGYMSAADKVRVDAIETIADSRITAQKGMANGIVPLDGTSKILATYLPSYVDDVEEYANLAAFPVTGEAGKIYVALDSNKTYRWSGSVYVEISASEVLSVNGFVGVVSLTTTNIPEGTNLYYTAARFNAAFAGKSTTDLTEGTNLYYTQARFDSAFAAKSTTDLAEGTNLYHTTARARNAVSATAPLNYVAGTGVFSIPAAAGPSTNGYLLGSDKVKLDRILQGFLQYNNLNSYTRTGTAFTDTVLDTDLSSFPNGLVTKLSTTEFRTDFAGRIKLHYSLSGAAAGNNRGLKAQVVKNGTLVPNTHRRTASSSAVSQGQLGHTQIIECAVNDVFKLQTASEDANTVTFGAGETSMMIEAFTAGLT